MKHALILIGAAAGVVAAGGELLARTWHLGYWHGVYCALGTASTDGCDTSPRSAAGWAAACAVILVAIPLLAAAYSSLHVSQVRKHLDAHHDTIRRLLGQPSGEDSDGG